MQGRINRGPIPRYYQEAKMLLLRPERAGGGGRGTEPLREAGVVEPSAEAWAGGGCASE